MRSEVRMRSNESCVERSKTFWMHFLNNGRFIVCVGRIRSQEKGHSYHEQCVLIVLFLLSCTSSCCYTFSFTTLKGLTVY